MRIKWNSNFQIEDSNIQFSEAFIKIQSFENINDTCIVSYIITDESEQSVAKQVSHLYNRNFINETEIYNILLTEYENSEIVA